MIDKKLIKRYPIKVIDTKGESKTIYMSVNMKEIILDVDMYNHIAWAGRKNADNTKTGKINKFNNKYGDLF